MLISYNDFPSDPDRWIYFLLIPGYQSPPDASVAPIIDVWIFFKMLFNAVYIGIHKIIQFRKRRLAPL